MYQKNKFNIKHNTSYGSWMSKWTKQIKVYSLYNFRYALKHMSQALKRFVVN